MFKETKPTPKVAKVEKIERININNVDHEWSDVLKYVQKGVDVVFEAEPELILPDPHSDVYKSLPYNIQLLWVQTKDISKYMKEIADDDESDRDWVGGVKVGLSATSFQGRFDVEGKDPGRHYYWPTPEQKDMFGVKGWRVETSPSIKTCGPQTNGEHHIVINGKCQHVLMSIDNERYDASQKRKSDRYQRAIHGKDEEGTLMTRDRLAQKGVDVENG